MNTAKRIEELRKERGWTIYRLSIETGLAQQSIRGWLDPNKRSSPTVATIEILCDAFGITLVDFFTEETTSEIPPEIAKLYYNWSTLSIDEQQQLGKLIQKLINRK